MAKSVVDRFLDGLAQRLVVRDSWSNLLTGMGRAGIDKRQSTTFQARTKLSQTVLEALWMQDSLSRRIVSRRTEEMTREWVDFKVEGDEDAGDALSAEFKRLCVASRVEEAMNWGRLYGGSILIIGADDGQQFNQPLNLQGIRSVRYLQVVDRWNCYPDGFEENPDDPAFRTPKYYRLLGGEYIHHSRTIAFHGAILPWNIYRNERWHDSVLESVWNTLSDFATGLSGMSSALHDYSVTVVGMDGLRNALSTGKNDVIINRAAAAQATMSMFRMMIHDGEHEKVQRMAHTLTGMPDAIDRLLDLVAAAADEPKAILFGNAIGKVSGADNDLKVYYDRTKAKQTAILIPALEQLATTIFAAKAGPFGGIEPDGWRINLRPLWQMSAKEKAEVRKTNAEADQIEVQIGAVTPFEVRMSRHGNDDDDNGIALDPEVTDLMAMEKLPEPPEPPAPAPGPAPRITPPSSLPALPKPETEPPEGADA